MTRKEQDKRWNSRTKEEQDSIIADYEAWKTTDLFKKDFVDRVLKVFENEFGTHNLKPTLTYEDIAIELFMEKRVYYFDWDEYDKLVSSIHTKSEDWYKSPLNCTSERQGQKLKAINKLLNVAKFLNKDWVPDWKNIEEPKWSIRIEWDEQNNEVIKVGHYLGTNGHCNNSIVYFRTKELAEQAVQILGEETIRLALSCDF